MKYILLLYTSIYVIPLLYDAIYHACGRISRYSKICRCSICENRTNLGLNPIHD